MPIPPMDCGALPCMGIEPEPFLTPRGPGRVIFFPAVRAFGLGFAGDCVALGAAFLRAGTLDLALVPGAADFLALRAGGAFLAGFLAAISLALRGVTPTLSGKLGHLLGSVLLATDSRSNSCALLTTTSGLGHRSESATLPQRGILVGLSHHALTNSPPTPALRMLVRSVDVTGELLVKTCVAALSWSVDVYLVCVKVPALFSSVYARASV